MAHFVLVHGAMHGAWCWDYVRPQLEKLGHAATAVDLPVDREDGAPKLYAETVAGAVRSGTSVVVGHSMAGIVIPLVADMINVSGLVYLCPVLRRPGSSLAKDKEDGANADFVYPGSGADIRISEDGFFAYQNPEAAIADFYHDCAPELASWAAKKLRRQRRFFMDVSPQSDWPDVRQACIVCGQDRTMNPAWQRRVSREWLGVEPIEMPGSHSPFFSRPGELARVLDRLAAAFGR
jgi:pimeloyl-ACP methyl ester carboxylesterase